MMDFRARGRGVENYTTAADTALLLERTYRGELIDRHWSRRGMELLMRQKLRDRIPSALPPEVVVAHKTGLERHVCHDAGVIVTTNGDILVVVLTRHPHSTSQRSKAFIGALGAAAYHYLIGS
jgi:beta-lactamase class A